LAKALKRSDGAKGGRPPFEAVMMFKVLVLQALEVLKHNPLGGNLFCFRGKRGNLLKVIWHDGQGACLFTKRLERGRFIWPTVEGGVVTVSPAQLSYLLSGIDWRNVACNSGWIAFFY
ncbi:IS66 family insertion sequence element accessory protein TnpB, partial [Mesorhizobium robiniae]